VVALRPRTLGPLALEPFESLRFKELHLLKVSLAPTTPAPTVTLNVWLPFFRVSEPENVSVCVGGGAEATAPVGAEVALVEPALLEAVTVTSRVFPTSAACAP
jgi:hypothetical protein